MKNFLFILFICSFNVGFAQLNKMDTVQIKTSSVCGMCKKNIEAELVFTKGVKRATLDVATQTATIVFIPKKTNVDKLRKAINKVGYDADSSPANPKAYEKLADCCKKNNAIHLD